MPPGGLAIHSTHTLDDDHDDATYQRHSRLSRPALALFARRRGEWFRIRVGADPGETGWRSHRNRRHDDAGADTAIAAQREDDPGSGRQFARSCREGDGAA